MQIQSILVLTVLATLAIDTRSLASDDWREITPENVVARLPQLLRSAEMTNADYWVAKPQLTAALDYSLTPGISETQIEFAAKLRKGEFSPNRLFPWKSVGVPPPWEKEAYQSRTANFYLHSLRWLRPLIHTWQAKKDRESLELVKEVLKSWWRANSDVATAPEFAWHDHATASRLRVISWFWELWRPQAKSDPDFARDLLASVYQHLLFAGDNANYMAASNHGMFMDASLLAATTTFQEFNCATGLKKHAYQRLQTWIKNNFSKDGVNLEQSPGYHWYVIANINRIVKFLEENHEPVPPSLTLAVKKANAVLPWMVRSDGSLSNLGDSDSRFSKNWRSLLVGYSKPAPSVAANPRDDDGSFFISYESGYAIFTAYPIDSPKPKYDTWLSFRCNSRYVTKHCHRDALSFELFGLSRDWLVDSGKYHYEKSIERKYLTGPWAHNTVIVDRTHFDYPPVWLIESGRTNSFDVVAAQIDHSAVKHTRRVEFRPPFDIAIDDLLAPQDNQQHQYMQLFHIAPGLNVDILKDNRTVVLSDSNNNRCTIVQRRDTGVWSVVRGQRQPRLLGWYARRHGEIEPITVLIYAATSAADHRFETHIAISPAKNTSESNPTTTMPTQTP